MNARPGFPSSAESEELFRRIFFTHLEADGFSRDDSYQLIFKTPAPFHGAPADGTGLELLTASKDSYKRQLTYGWFFEGLHEDPELDEQYLEAPERPVTLIVVPGIFGEFIEKIPFESVVESERTRFRKKWQAALDETPEQLYSLLETTDVPCRLSDVVAIGSMDQGARSFANVIVLKAEAGSLETLGTLAANAAVYERRLAKVFEVIDDDSDIYLVGYSRGMAVSLELISTLHEQRKAGTLSPESAAWFERLKGVVGLAGVYYGAQFAQDVLSGESGATSDLMELLGITCRTLKTVPKDAKLTEKARIVDANTHAWTDFVKKATADHAPKIAGGKSFMGSVLHEVAMTENKVRFKMHRLHAPNPKGILTLVQHFFLKTFSLRKFVTRYNENVLSLQKLLEAVTEALTTLTPSSRDEWWRSHELPDDLVLLSLTGSMPDAYIHGLVSPLWYFKGYGAKTSDFNMTLRTSYYDALAAENTLMNDSQVSHFASRYWTEMYPDHRYEHHYLGIVGTHHWGMAFPFTIEDKKSVGGNQFPRKTMLRSIAAYLGSDYFNQPRLRNSQ